MSTVEFNNTLTSLESYLLAFAMNYTKNMEDARDLTQETMLKAIRYKDYYTPKTNFKAWVFTIMKNIFINQYRRKVKSGTIFDNSTDLYLLNGNTEDRNSPENHIANQEIQAKFNSLADEYKEPFEMHYLGFKYKEIAEKLGVKFPIDVDRRIDGGAAVGAHRTSMWQDLDMGRPMEIDALVGSVKELGRITDTPTPTIDVVLGLIQMRGKIAGVY